MAILYVTAKKSTIFERARRRAEITGRVVPEAVILQTMRDLPRSVRTLSPIVDFVATFANENDPGVPVLLHSIRRNSSLSLMALLESSSQDSYGYIGTSPKSNNNDNNNNNNNNHHHHYVDVSGVEVKEGSNDLLTPIPSDDEEECPVKSTAPPSQISQSNHALAIEELSRATSEEYLPSPVKSTALLSQTPQSNQHGVSFVEQTPIIATTTTTTAATTAAPPSTTISLPPDTVLPSAPSSSSKRLRQPSVRAIKEIDLMVQDALTALETSSQKTSLSSEQLSSIGDDPSVALKIPPAPPPAAPPLASSLSSSLPPFTSNEPPDKSFPPRQISQSNHDPPSQISQSNDEPPPFGYGWGLGSSSWTGGGGGFGGGFGGGGLSGVYTSSGKQSAWRKEFKNVWKMSC